MAFWHSYHTTHIKEKYLFRFVSLKHLEDFLTNGTVWFSRADKFMDKMECVHVSDLVGKKPDFERIKRRKFRYLISCWHVADHESLALWDSYATSEEDRRRVAICFDRKQLVSYMHDFDVKNHIRFYNSPLFLHGGVVYSNLVTADSMALSKAGIKYPAFRKEAAFKYENEYRFVIEQKNEAESGFAYMLDDPKYLDFKIIINPLLESEDYIKVGERINELGFWDKHELSALAKWMKPELW